MKKKHIRLIALCAGGLFILVILVWGLLHLGKFVLPNDFTDARKDAASTSQSIVDLTNQIRDKIKAANVLDGNGNYDEAVRFIKEARDINSEAYKKAPLLANDLQKITESLSGVPSEKSQRLALEAVATELSLVSEFIGYTETLNAFLDSLATAIDTGSYNARMQATDILNQVNSRAEKINSLNRDFQTRMETFDSSL